MGFWDTFWATTWGALAGALVGAIAAWIFSLDLARRSREAAQADDVARRDAQEASAYLALMAAMVGRVVETLHSLAAEIDGIGGGTFSPASIDNAETSLRRARAAALAATDVARVHSRGSDRRVFEVLRYAIERLPDNDTGANQALDLGLRVVEWDWTDPTGTNTVVAEVVDIVPSVAGRRDGPNT